MIRSMTGYGCGQVNQRGWLCMTEIRAVNQRFLDIRLKTPHGFQELEQELKSLIKQSCGRGKLDCAITLQPEENGSGQWVLNTELAKSYGKIIKEFAQVTQQPVQISLKDLLSIENLVQSPQADPKDHFFGDLLKSSLEEALKALIQMKVTEGEALLKDLRFRFQTCGTILKSIETAAKAMPALYYERLRKNLNELDPSLPLDKDRLHQEVAHFADRCDITEEIVRFQAHLQHIEEIFQQPEVGKKAEFLMQEMNREINTIGSKSNQLEISQAVVQIKSELEKAREQIQNIE